MMGVAAPARLIASDKAERMMEADLYVRPKPQAVARLVASHGSEVARNRWWYVNERTLASLLRVGRLQLGWDAPTSNGRKRSIPLDVDHALVATAIVLGSASVADRAGEVHSGATIGACEARAFRPPGSIAHLKGARALESKRAAAGDPDAIAAIAVRHAHERAVYAVVKAALALVPEQPATGPVVLPEHGPELVAALAGHDPAAVEAAFPGLDMSPAPTPEPEPAIEEQPAVSKPAWNIGRPRKAPTEDVVGATCAATPAPTRNELASRWGMSPSGVALLLRKYGIELPYSPRGGGNASSRRPHSAEVVPLTLVPPTPAPAPEVVAISTLSIPCSAGQPALMRALSVEELSAAFQLARLTGMDGRDALTWIRADLALVKSELARGQA